MTRSDKWRTVLRMVAITAPLGALVGAFPNVVSGDGTRAVVTGGVIGLLITIGMAAFSVSWVVELVPRRWREAPFLVVLVTRSLVWLAIIALGIGLPLMAINRTPLSQLTTGRIGVLVAISFTAALILSFIGQVNRLLGRGVMTRLILGRYHRPREENRIFLLVDLKGSTQIAEQLGNLRYHEFVKRFIGDVAANAVRHGGEVHRYVGDEVIVTWSEQRGLADAACIRAVFAITDALAHARPDYDAEFGIVPSIWAGLHIGQVVTGEVGTVKHEIVYLGDALNTAARIEEACKTYQRPFLASADVVNALELPADMAAESLGLVELRGVGSAVELMAVNRTA